MRHDVVEGYWLWCVANGVLLHWISNRTLFAHIAGPDWLARSN
jgi:hypothetical protein